LRGQTANKAENKARSNFIRREFFIFASSLYTIMSIVNSKISHGWHVTLFEVKKISSLPCYPIFFLLSVNENRNANFYGSKM
jgi:hypothetical protein